MNHLDLAIEDLSIIQLSMNYADFFPHLKDQLQIRKTEDLWAIRCGFRYEVEVEYKNSISYFTKYSEVIDYLECI